MRLLAFCSSGLFIATAQLGFFLRNASMVHSVGTMLSCPLSWPISFANFVAQAAQKEVNMSQFDFIRVGGGAV